MTRSSSHDSQKDSKRSAATAGVKQAEYRDRVKSDIQPVVPYSRIRYGV